MAISPMCSLMLEGLKSYKILSHVLLCRGGTKEALNILNFLNVLFWVGLEVEQ